MCRKLLISLLALLAVCSSLWAFPGRVTGSLAARPTDTSDQAVLADAPKTDSGKTQETISVELPRSLADEETVTKAAEGRRLSGEEAAALYDELMAIEGNMAALREMSNRKDEVIDALSAENASMKDETGTKTYLMLDGLLGFSGMAPQYGLGLSLGTRLGNSLMLELGVDYMLGGSVQDVMDFSLDDFTFRAGIGWMF